MLDRDAVEERREPRFAQMPGPLNSSR